MKTGMINRRQFLRFGVGAAAMALGGSLVGCGGGGSGSGSGSKPKPPAVVSPYGYLADRGIYASYVTADEALYRQMLPALLDLPDTLRFNVLLFDFYSVKPEVVPYREFALQLTCSYQGQPGMYLAYLALNETVPTELGIEGGYPKVLAEQVDLDHGPAAWHGQVIRNGITEVQLTATPTGAPSITAELIDPPEITYTLVPVGVGPTVNQFVDRGRMDMVLQPASTVVTVDPSLPWASLVMNASYLSSRLIERSGELHITLL